MRSAVAGLPGVKGSLVDYSAKTLTLKVDEGFDPDAAVAALQAKGYGATPE